MGKHAFAKWNNLFPHEFNFAFPYYLLKNTLILYSVAVQDNEKNIAIFWNKIIFVMIWFLKYVFYGSLDYHIENENAEERRYSNVISFFRFMDVNVWVLISQLVIEDDLVCVCYCSDNLSCTPILVSHWPSYRFHSY